MTGSLLVIIFNVCVCSLFEDRFHQSVVVCQNCCMQSSAPETGLLADIPFFMGEMSCHVVVGLISSSRQKSFLLPVAILSAYVMVEDHKLLLQVSLMGSLYPRLLKRLCVCIFGKKTLTRRSTDSSTNECNLPYTPSNQP